MILEALYRHYEDLLMTGKVAKRGWSLEKVSAALCIDEEGRLVNILPLQEKVAGTKKSVTRMLVPQHEKHSVKILPMYLCDPPSYLLGVDNKGDSERSRRCFIASSKLHQKNLEQCTSSTAAAIRHFFKNWNPDKANENDVFRAYQDEIMSASNLVFWVNGTFAHKDEEIVTAWNSTCCHAEDNAPEGICLVTGKRAPIARLHPQFQIAGAQSSGAPLVSFNKDKISFSSYGKDKEQGLNAHVSENAAFAYGTALKYLLNDEHHKKRIGDMTVVYWAEQQNEVSQDIFSGMGFDDGNMMEQQTLNAILQAVKEGKPIVYSGQEIPYNNDFFILGLSPNAGRISVRFFYRNSFGEILSCIQQHHERMEIVRPGGKEWSPISLRNMLLATVSPNVKDKTASPPMAGTVFRSILTGRHYPVSLYQNVMRRIKAEQDETEGKDKHYKISDLRVAIIKAYLMKNKGRQITVALNENCEDTAYVLGRIFSVWEQIQKAVNPELNSTIKDRYFNAACATPTAVFSKLQILANHHLRNLRTQKPGLAITFDKKLTEIMSKLHGGEGLPKTLSLDEQGMFILGYYHQTQKRFEKKEDK